MHPGSLSTCVVVPSHSLEWASLLLIHKCSVLLRVPPSGLPNSQSRDWRTFSAKGQTMSISDFVSHWVFVPSTQRVAQTHPETIPEQIAQLSSDKSLLTKQVTLDLAHRAAGSWPCPNAPSLEDLPFPRFHFTPAYIWWLLNHFRIQPKYLPRTRGPDSYNLLDISSLTP